jgi:hypothetical protein
MEEHRLGELWAACLWDMRQKIGDKTADRLVFASWNRFKPIKGELNKPKFFVDAIISNLEGIGANVDQKVAIRGLFARRNLD